MMKNRITGLFIFKFAEYCLVYHPPKWLYKCTPTEEHIILEGGDPSSLTQGSVVSRGWRKSQLCFNSVLPLAPNWSFSYSILPCPWRWHSQRKYMVSRVGKIQTFWPEARKGIYQVTVKYQRIFGEEDLRNAGRYSCLWPNGL